MRTLGLPMGLVKYLVAELSSAMRYVVLWSSRLHQA